MNDTTLIVPSDPTALASHLAAQGMSDGLPVVPPTLERVRAMLGPLADRRDEELGWMPPGWGKVTPHHIAINAVMAGCGPEHFPILLAAVRAMLQPEFNLYGIQVTTNPVAPLVVVHGPIASRVKVNGGIGAFGPGTYANAVIGRAVRLVLINVGGGIPGGLDRSTQGGAAKYTYCVAENEANSPWPPYHVRRGYAPGSSAVTIFGVQAQHNIGRLTAQNARQLLDLFGAAMSTPGTNNMTYGGELMLAIPPENARLLSDAGFDPDLAARYLYERVRVDVTHLSPEAIEVVRERRAPWVDPRHLPLADRPEGIHLIVVGGLGGHSQYLPSFGPTLAVTVPIEE